MAARPGRAKERNLAAKCQFREVLEEKVRPTATSAQPLAPCVHGDGRAGTRTTTDTSTTGTQSKIYFLFTFAPFSMPLDAAAQNFLSAGNIIFIIISKH